MSYASIHRSNERFLLVVVLVLIGTGLTTMALMFIHPTAAILLFWFGLLIAFVAAMIELNVRHRERTVIRQSIARRECPQCGGEVHLTDLKQQSWRCDRCESDFAQDGRQLA